MGWKVGLLVVSLVFGCAALRDDLQRAEDNYNQARYDDAEVWLRGLEGQDHDMARTQRIRFHYLRGMTAFRLGKPDDALYYLAIARELVADDEAALRAEWRQALDRTLDELTPEDASHRARNPESSRSQ